MEAEIETYKAEVLKDPYIFHSGKHTLPRQAILHYLRSSIEEEHALTFYHQLWHPSWMYRPRLEHVQDPTAPKRFDGGTIDNGTLSMPHAISCYNKSAPFYVVGEKWNDPWIHIPTCIHTWLWQEWFRPYRSEIDNGQFVAKIIAPDGSLSGYDIEGILDLTVKLNDKVCSEAERMRTYLNGCTNMPQSNSPRGPELSEQKIFQLQPLFRAIAVVIDGNNCKIHERDTCNAPVYLVQTGVEEGLSSPIDFASLHEGIEAEGYVGQDGKTRQIARTTIKVAFDVIMKLDKREKTLFGMKADHALPSAGWGNMNRMWGMSRNARSLEEQARRLGWEGDFDAEGSSSEWVDETVFPDWIGPGADWAQELERAERACEQEYLRRLQEGLI